MSSTTQTDEGLQAEAANPSLLSLQLSQLESIYQSAPVGLCVLDDELRYVRINNRLAAMNGFSPEAHLGQTLRQMVPYVADQIEPYFREVLATGVPMRNLELHGERAPDAGVTSYWVENVYPLRDANGRVVGLNVVVEDITARKQLEVELRELTATLEEKVRRRTEALEATGQQLAAARDLFRTLFNTAPMPIAISRIRDGRIIDVNDEQLRYFGVRREDVIGKTSLELGMWTNAADRERIVGELAQKGRIYGNEVHVPLPSGEMHTALISLAKIELDGEACMIGALVDITDRVKAEQMVRYLALELTRAEQKERRDIARVLHDELQQSLYGVQAQLHLLLRHADSGSREERKAEVRETLASLGEAIGVARQLTVDLSPPVLHGEGLTDAVQWLVTQMGTVHRLRVNVEADQAFVIPDGNLRVLLFQVIRELLLNVAAHAGVDEARVELRDADGDLVLRVSDTGRGFNVDAQQPAGKGFGLFSIRERMQLLGGTFRVDARPNEGTTVTVHLPRWAAAGGQARG